MAWMAEFASILSSRQAKASLAGGRPAGAVQVHIEAIDALHFISPSKTGDRISLHGHVTRVFGTSMEATCPNR